MALKAAGSAIDTWFGAMRTKVPAKTKKRGSDRTETILGIVGEMNGPHCLCSSRTTSGLWPQSSVCKLGELRPRNGLYSALICDIWDQMGGPNDEGDRVDDDCRLLAGVEAKGWGRHEEGWETDCCNTANRLKGLNV